MGSSEQGTDLKRWNVIPRTLCFITNGNDVLLMKRGLHKRIFPGRYNGVGGHLERNEDPYHSALREVLEETGLSISDLQFRGVSNIDAQGDSGIMLFVFTAVSADRTVIPCDEGTLEWIPLDHVAALPLVEDILIYLDRLFGKNASSAPFFAHVCYDENDQMVIQFA